MVAGYYAHKHRKDIIGSVNSATGKGKDFVLQQIFQGCISVPGFGTLHGLKIYNVK
jgi:hypothetical protein